MFRRDAVVEAFNVARPQAPKGDRHDPGLAQRESPGLKSQLSQFDSVIRDHFTVITL